ncbi:nucleotidyltransferase family protein [bacterium]|nr:nucleotidyltransferase family protein [bacterium]
MKVKGLILSGGMSSRMAGKPKALCKFDDQFNFLDRIIHIMKCAGLHDITVVTGCHDSEIRKHGLESGGEKVSYLLNSGWKSGMLSSIQSYIRSIESLDVDGFIMVPVDHPFVEKSTYSQILVNCNKKNIVIPKYNDSKGHPVFWGKSFFDQLLSADPNIGAREVSRANKDKIIFINTQDSGILKDIDTVKEYEDWVGKKIRK